MTLSELYQQPPVSQHPEIVVSGNRVFFDGAEYLLLPGGEMKLLRSQKALEQKLDEILARLSGS